MKFVIAIDSFKGCMTSSEAGVAPFCMGKINIKETRLAANVASLVLKGDEYGDANILTMYNYIITPEKSKFLKKL